MYGDATASNLIHIKLQSYFHVHFPQHISDFSRKFSVAMASHSLDCGSYENHTDTHKDSRRLSLPNSHRKTPSVCCRCLRNVMETVQPTRHGYSDILLHGK